MTTPDLAVNTLNYDEQGGARKVIGGEIDIVTGGKIKKSGVDITGALATPLAGVAAAYKLARSAAPIALDGSNPTSFAHGLTTIVAAVAMLTGTDAPGVSTSTLTLNINGANVDVYGWKPTSSSDPTLVASGGGELFNWVAVGT